MFTNSDFGVHEVWLHLGDKYNTSNMCHFYQLFCNFLYNYFLKDHVLRKKVTYNFRGSRI